MSTRQLAAAIRAQALRMVHRANASHIGSALSCADLLAVLYGGVLRVDPARPDWTARDRFILSKGHAAVALYAALAEVGFFPRTWLGEYGSDGSPLLGHVTHHVPGIEFSSGALGHGLAVGCGLAMALRHDGHDARACILMGDGELNEGSVWEAALIAAHHRLANLVAIVDINGQQGFGATQEILDMHPLADKWTSFGWRVVEIDGHDHAQILQACTPAPGERPTVILARTVKGCGVSFMEHQLAWHYKSPNAEQLAQALAEVEGGR